MPLLDETHIEDSVNTPLSTCATCSKILLPPLEPGEHVPASSLAITRRFEQLLTEEGIDVHVPRGVFRQSVESGCAICVAVYQDVLRDVWTGKADAFKVGARVPGFDLTDEDGDDNWESEVLEAQVGHGEEELLVLNFHASTVGDYSDTYSRHEPHAEKTDPFNLVELHVVPLGAHERGVTSGLYFDIFASSDDPASHFVASRPANPEMDTAASVQVAQEWIKQCKQSHPSCSSDRLVPELPTRVIDVRPSGDFSQADEQQQVCVQSLSVRAEYAALSYCWGGPQPITLNKNTRDRLERGVSLNDLPSTVSDAIWWTRQLGLRYIWVDALCIIQDDLLDKAKEMGAMQSIYAQATVTLSVARSPSVRSGFRQTRAPDLTSAAFSSLSGTLSRCAISYPCPDLKLSGSSRGYTLGTVIVQEMCTYRLTEEPLNKRGWTLQESLLSPRVLTFGSQQLYWACQTTHAANGGKLDSFEHRIQRLSSTVFKAVGARALQGEQSLVGAESAIEVRTLWRQIVEQFSSRRLSDSADRLPALAGLAFLFKCALGGENYLAGLWEKTMPQSLDWAVITPEPRGRDISRTRNGASWSWATVDSLVEWRENNFYNSRRYLHVSLETKLLRWDVCEKFVEAPLGEIKHGMLELRGRLRRFNWGGHTELWKTSLEVDAEVRPDYSEIQITVEKFFETGEHQEERMAFFMGRDGESKRNCGSEIPVVALPVSGHASLVLTKSDLRPGVAEESFERLGVLEFDFIEGSDWETNLQEFFRGCDVSTVMLR